MAWKSRRYDWMGIGVADGDLASGSGESRADADGLGNGWSPARPGRPLPRMLRWCDSSPDFDVSDELPVANCPTFDLEGRGLLATDFSSWSSSPNVVLLNERRIIWSLWTISMFHVHTFHCGVSTLSHKNPNLLPDGLFHQIVPLLTVYFPVPQPHRADIIKKPILEKLGKFLWLGQSLNRNRSTPREILTNQDLHRSKGIKYKSSSNTTCRFVGTGFPAGGGWSKILIDGPRNSLALTWGEYVTRYSRPDQREHFFHECMAYHL